MQVTIIRGAGTRPMDVITETVLAGSEAAMRARAESELDACSPDARQVDIEIVPQAGIQVGQIVRVNESGQPTRLALVQRIQMTVGYSDVSGSPEQSMTVTVEYRV